MEKWAKVSHSNYSISLITSVYWPYTAIPYSEFSIKQFRGENGHLNQNDKIYQHKLHSNLLHNHSGEVSRSLHCILDHNIYMFVIFL